MPFRPRVCAECAAEFLPTDAKSKFCPACRNRTCPTCNEPFVAALTDRGLSRYCSNRCYLRGRWGESEEHHCLRCGQRITTHNRKQLYCSLVCAEAARAGRPVPSRLRQVTKPCAWCGEAVTRARSDFHGARVFCNASCQGEWLSEFQVGEAHPRWKGGDQDDYGAGWKKARRGIQLRSGGTCERCRTRPVSQVHHLIPIRMFRTPNDSHHPTNLVALCRQCHAAEHRKLATSLPLLNLLLSTTRRPRRKRKD